MVHEIKPVTAGYRLVITYNLVRTGYRGPTSGNVVISERIRLKSILEEWHERETAKRPTLKKLVYVMDHKYTEANLRLERLKGRDLLIGQYLSKAFEETGFNMFFGSMKLTISNVGEDYDEEEQEEVLELENITRTNGQLFLYSARIQKEEIIQADVFDRIPDEETSEETGNEGTDTTHFYHNTVSPGRRYPLLPQTTY